MPQVVSVPMQAFHVDSSVKETQLRRPEMSRTMAKKLERKEKELQQVKTKLKRILYHKWLQFLYKHFIWTHLQ
ncbi:hypothetical protein DsansV1_C04g0037091 [Dioscorea sansibarensis]